MNINLIKLKGVIHELTGIRYELSRLADCWEMELSQHGINVRLPQVDNSGPPPTIDYVDEEMEWARESIDRLRRMDDLKTKEEEEV